jgi:hypothetical protein
MTLEGRKYAFKKSVSCGPATIILTALILYFSLAKAYDAAPLDMLGLSQLGGTVFVTSMICTCIQYPIIKKAYKNQFNGGEKLPDMGPRDAQVAFWRWIPANWLCYNIVISAFAGILFGSGIPAFLAAWGINPGGINRLGYSILAGIINGLGTWYAVYLCQIYTLQLLAEKDKEHTNV